MQQEFRSKNSTDDNGNPTGGHAVARGVTVVWQDGPLGREPEERERNENGAFVETVIAIAKDRLEFYQGGRFACDENAEAIDYLKAALDRLQLRTHKRETRGVEGTHKV